MYSCDSITVPRSHYRKSDTSVWGSGKREHFSKIPANKKFFISGMDNKAKIRHVASYAEVSLCGEGNTLVLKNISESATISVAGGQNHLVIKSSLPKGVTLSIYGLGNSVEIHGAVSPDARIRLNSRDNSLKCLEQIPPLAVDITLQYLVAEAYSELMSITRRLVPNYDEITMLNGL